MDSITTDIEPSLHTCTSRTPSIKKYTYKCKFPLKNSVYKEHFTQEIRHTLSQQTNFEI
jgi:hypothetical protein